MEDDSYPFKIYSPFSGIRGTFVHLPAALGMAIIFSDAICQVEQGLKDRRLFQGVLRMHMNTCMHGSVLCAGTVPLTFLFKGNELEGKFLGKTQSSLFLI